MIRAAGRSDQPLAERPEWGVYADDCWLDWPGEVLDWPDFGVPADSRATVDRILSAWGRAVSGQDILVGCHGGRGRTGAILACFAVLAGVPEERVIEWVRAHHYRDAVETAAQAAWVTEVFAADPRAARMRAASRDRLVDAQRARIVAGTRAAFQRPEDAPVLVWAVPEILAVSQRPLRCDPLLGGRRGPLPEDARPVLLAWVDRLVAQGINSLVVLTSHAELSYYDDLTAGYQGLLGLYRSRGLTIEHLPADDPAHDTTAAAAFFDAVEEIAERVVVALGCLPGPALMHCSAAIDRSPHVAARVAFLALDCGLPLAEEPPVQSG